MDNGTREERDVARFWNAIFVEDQNNTDLKPDDYFYTAFHKAIGEIGHTLLVLEPWRARAAHALLVRVGDPVHDPSARRHAGGGALPVAAWRL